MRSRTPLVGALLASAGLLLVGGCGSSGGGNGAPSGGLSSLTLPQIQSRLITPADFGPQFSVSASASSAKPPAPLPSRLRMHLVKPAGPGQSTCAALETPRSQDSLQGVPITAWASSEVESSNSTSQAGAYVVNEQIDAFSGNAQAYQALTASWQQLAGCSTPVTVAQSTQGASPMLMAVQVAPISSDQTAGSPKAFRYTISYLGTGQSTQITYGLYAEYGANVVLLVSQHDLTVPDTPLAARSALQVVAARMAG